MGLRESIIGIIWGSTSKDSEIITDKILKEIEKRINEERNNMGSIQVQNAYHVFELLGYGQGLEKVKEMLK